MVGICGLCGQTRELQQSHLLPRALYKRLRDKSRGNPNPLLFSAKDEHQTSRQAVQYLLCSECEQRFHRYGEDWTLEQCARDANMFPLRDLLLRYPCDRAAEDFHIFRTAHIPTINAEALCYFALSVIWRAAVRRWRIDDQVNEQLRLGSVYTEAFRAYLLGSESFPDDTALFVCASSFQEVPLICTLPQTRNWGDYRSHFFSIPGLTFTVNVGKRIPDFVRQACLYRSVGRLLFYTPLEDLVNIRDFARLAEMRETTT